jgi:hypothetical protein
MYERGKIMTKFKTQTRWIAIASAAAATVFLSGCVTTHSNERRLDIWKVGENKDLVLVRSMRPLSASDYEAECRDGKLGSRLQDHLENRGKALEFIKKDICPKISQLKLLRGFKKSDFFNGNIISAALVTEDLTVDIDDIVEVSSLVEPDGRLSRLSVVTRVIRKNVLKERDPTCYWDGQSGRFDSFATGGVVCPAEGWDWRDQKWSKK